MLACLVDPTSSKAVGARILDRYMIPTTTHHQKRRIKVYSDANGNAELTVFSHPYFSYLSNSNQQGSTSHGGILGTEGRYGGSLKMFHFTTPEVMKNECSSFRVVGGGCRIRGLQNLHDGIGTLTCAQLPCTNVYYPPNALDNGNALSYHMLLQKATGIQPVSYSVGDPGITQSLPPSLYNLPNSREYNFTTWNAHSIRVANKPVGTRYQDFHVAHDTEGTTEVIYQGTDAYDSNAESATTGIPMAINKNGTTDQSRLGGHTATMIQFNGCIPHTLIAEIEMVVHYELTPQINSSNTAFADSSTPSPSSEKNETITTTANNINGSNPMTDASSDQVIQQAANKVEAQSSGTSRAMGWREVAEEAYRGVRTSAMDNAAPLTYALTNQAIQQSYPIVSNALFGG